MSSREQRDRRLPVADGDDLDRPRAPLARFRLSRNLIATVPIVLVSSIAVSLGLHPPAHATTLSKRQAKEKEPPGDTITGDLDRESAPSPQPLSTASGVPRQYTVAIGDTVSEIAARFGLSTAHVLAINGLSWSTLIFPGQVIVLTDGAAAPPSPAPPPPDIRHYTVVAGDTISEIAAAHGLSTDAVLSANGLSRTSIIYPGQAIVLPDASPAPAAPAPEPAPGPAEPDPAPVASITAIVALTDEMRGNAQVIVRVGREEGVGDRGLVVALTAAMQESGLRNLDYGDRDSLGLFQQRPSTGWGTPAQVMDPVRSARAFFGGADNPNPGRTRGLLDVPGWESMSIAQAAQAVQISAYPDAYAQWVPSARAWLAEF